jgi:hypothetical protein
VFEGHSYAFARQVALLKRLPVDCLATIMNCAANAGRARANFVQKAARRLATFIILERLRRLVADSASFPAHHSWGLVFAWQSAARSHQAFAKGAWT